MKSKENIIIEETGCDEEQAKLSLRESGDNLQKAIKSIASTLKYIAVIKGKFIYESVSIYGLFVTIVNLREEIIMRQAAVVSNNPAIYENDMDLKWHIFEKRLYVLRLHEGSLHETTSKFEQDFSWQIKKNYRQTFFQLIRDKKANELMELLKSVISGSLSSTGVKIRLKMEELSLNQFRELTDENISITERKNNDNNHSREIIMETELVGGDGRQDSIEAEKLKERYIVLTSITDNRDIAQYLSKLLGGRKRDKIIPLTAMVEKIKNEDNNLIVDTRFGPGIIGRAIVNRKTKVKIVRERFRKIVRHRKLLWLLITLIVLFGFIYYVWKIMQ